MHHVQILPVPFVLIQNVADYRLVAPAHNVVVLPALAKEYFGAEVAAFFLVAYIRSEEHTSELQSLMRISYAVFCLKQNNPSHHTTNNQTNTITINTNTLIHT